MKMPRSKFLEILIQLIQNETWASADFLFLFWAMPALCENPPGQGSNLGHSSNPNHRSDNNRFSTSRPPGNFSIFFLKKHNQ